MNLKLTILSIEKTLSLNGFIVWNQPCPPRGVIVVSGYDDIPRIEFISRNVGEQFEVIEKCHKLLQNDYTLSVEFRYEDREVGYCFSRFSLMVLPKGSTIQKTIKIR